MNKRIGVVLKNNKNLEKIFLYFSEPETSLLIYKTFCEDIFYYISSEDRIDTIKKISNNKHLKEESFNEILTRKILNKKGPFTLLELIKNIKLIDYENCNIIFFNDFIRALKRTDIMLDEDEKMKIFEQCDYYANKNLHYNNMINILVDQFWSEEKNNLTEDIFLTLTNNGKRCISINYIEKIFKNILHKRDLLNFIDKYKLISKNNSLEPISLKDFVKLIKLYNFGDDKSDFLNNLNSTINKRLNNINNIDIRENKKRHYSRSVGREKIKNNKNIMIYEKKDYLNQIIGKIKNIFNEYGRKSFFNFIKQFKYYEANDGLINRNSFIKVLKNFNIKLTIEEIEAIFNEFGVDYSKNYIYHEDFIKFLSVKTTNTKRDDIIKNIFDILLERSGNFNEDCLTIKYLKENYNSKNNYFSNNESDNYLEFIDCLEMFHFCYKGFKYEKFTKKEFVEFYRLISFLVNDDEEFFSLIKNEWLIDKNELNNHFLTRNKNVNRYEKKGNNFLIDLKNELKKIGVKGLLNIHYKFLTFCPNISKISLEDFVNILNLNHINFDNYEFKDIFNYFSINKNNKLYLDYNHFIRFFKKELNETKLNIVEKIFLSFKNDFSDEKEEIPLNLIKNKYKAKRHPDVIIGIKTEEEKIREFRESFDINYNIFNSRLNNENYRKMVDFDMFANFYEYVSFIYEEDKDFVNLLLSTW